MALGAYHLPTFIRDTTVYTSGRPFDGWYPWAGADAMGANVNPIATEWIYAKPWSNVRALRTRSKLVPPSSTELGIDLGYIKLNNICFDPVDYFTIVAPDYGAQRLVISRDNASSWSTLKKFSRWVHRTRIHPHIPGCMMVLGDDALWLSNDHGTTWVNVTPPSTVGKGQGMVDMAFDSKDPLHLYLAYGGNQSQVKVAESTDGGKTWKSISQGLPSFAVFTMIDRAGVLGELYVGTSYGVYRRDSTGLWEPFGTGLPVTNVSFLEIDYPNGLLRAATNRGLWQVPIPPAGQPEAQISRNTDTVRCTRAPVRFGCRSAALETQAFRREWKFPGGVPASSSLPVVDVFYAVPGTYDAELVVTNEYGQSRSVLKNAVTVLPSECDGFDAVPGSAADLTRDGDHITLGRMPQKVREFTFTAWVKPNGMQPNFSAILCTDSDPNVSQEIGLQFANDKNELGYLWSGGRWWWSSGLTLRPDVWSHVALTIDSTGATVYVNGIPSKDATPLPAIDLSQLVFKLGTYHYWSSRNFKGLIDEVALYNRCLSLTEIRSGMHLTKSGQQDGLMAYYQFNESRIGTIYDKIAARDGRHEAGAGLVTSDAPVAGGRSELRRIAPGQRLAPFGVVGDTCVFYQPLSDSVDVVMTRFDRTAVAPPAQDKNCLEGSWRIFDVFGPVTVTEVSEMTLSADSRYMPESPSSRTWGILTRSGWNLNEPWSAARIPSNGELNIRGASITGGADRGLLTPLQLMVTYSGQPVSVDDKFAAPELVVTPQPAIDILRISAPEAITHVLVSDMSGRVLSDWLFPGTSHEQGVDVTGLGSGTYVVDVDGRRRLIVILR